MNGKLSTSPLLDSEKFKIFAKEFNGGDYTDNEIKFLFCKGHCNLPIDYIAKILCLRYVDALKLAKKLSDELNNLRLDKKLAIVYKEKVSSDRLLKVKAKQIRSIIDEIERRNNNPDRFSKTSEKKLFEILEKLESSVEVESEYYTGEIDEGSHPRERVIIRS